MKSGLEGLSELIVARSDTTEVFDFVKEPFDPIALPIEKAIMRDRTLAGAFGGDHRFGSILLDLSADGIAVVTFIEDGCFGTSRCEDLLVKRIEGGVVALLSRREQNAKGVALVEGCGVDLRRQTSPRAAKSLIRAVFLGAPAAC